MADFPSAASAAATAESQPAGTGEPPRAGRSLALSGLFVLAVLYTLYFARFFLLPLVLALLFTLLLAPAVDGLQKLRIPAGLGAAVIVLLLLGLVSAAGYLLIDPAITWFKRAPETLERVEAMLQPYGKPIEQFRRTTEKFQALTQIGREPRDLPLRVEPESFVPNLLGSARNMLTTLGITLALLYFLLASGDLFLRKLVHVLRTMEEKKQALEIARQLQTDISTYLLTITFINLGLGVAEGTVMHLLGMPNALLWGAMATLLNFIPYLGAMVGTAVIALVAALTFDVPGAVLLPPLCYYVLTATEGYLVTPLVLGRRLTLNPVVILLGLIFWGWLWGIIGALLAVPLIVSFKIFCEHIPPLAPAAELLGR